MKQQKPSLIEELIKKESAGGILLMFSAGLAMLCANVPNLFPYSSLIELPVTIQVGQFELSKPLLLWVNDGLMALFFLLVGLELKRELLTGELSKPKDIVLPFVGAIGGMAAPALIFLFFNYNNPNAVHGWAIPAATDIAFALGILSLLGKRVPLSLKVFLTSLAIFDDIGAVIIIALYYTSKISLVSLSFAAICITLLFTINRCGIKDRSPYFLIGLIMWIALLKSGVHATLSGIILAFFIPMTATTAKHLSPLKSLEKDLAPTVVFFILPVFAFCNSGIFLADIDLAQLMHPVTIGIALGLFFGNQIGITLMCFLAIKLKIANLPPKTSWGSFYGVAILCGVGFTMSLFIGSLAFEETGVNQLFDERIGIFLGSVISGVVGYVVLNRSLPKEPSN